VAPVPGLDLARFAAWFERACPGAVTGPLRARLLVGGRSNLTSEVSGGTRSWMVRRLPLAHVLATAHDMGRECRGITTGSLGAPGPPRGCRELCPAEGPARG